MEYSHDYLAKVVAVVDVVAVIVVVAVVVVAVVAVVVVVVVSWFVVTEGVVLSDEQWRSLTGGGRLAGVRGVEVGHGGTAPEVKWRSLKVKYNEIFTRQAGLRSHPVLLSGGRFILRSSELLVRREPGPGVVDGPGAGRDQGGRPVGLVLG